MAAPSYKKDVLGAPNAPPKYIIDFVLFGTTYCAYHPKFPLGPEHQARPVRPRCDVRFARRKRRGRVKRQRPQTAACYPLIQLRTIRR